jgi:hypothetical protein
MSEIEQAMPLDSSTWLNNPAAVRDDLEQVFKISSWLSFPFTVDEVAEFFLPGLNLTGDQVKALFTDGEIDLPFILSDRYLLTDGSQSIASRAERRFQSTAKIESAARFATVLKRLVPWIEMIAVTGSVAYGSARKWDDIDLFMVTKRDRLWLSLFLSLTLARLGKLLRVRDADLLSFCLSYVHDDLGFLQESSKSKSPLFARELLKARPLVGVRKYKQILESNEWIKLIHRAAYSSKLNELRDTESSGGNGEAASRAGSFFLQWADWVAFVLLRTYLKIRSDITNAKLKSKGQEFRVFDQVMNKHSCMYISNLYRWLQQIWRGQHGTGIGVIE